MIDLKDYGFTPFFEAQVNEIDNSKAQSLGRVTAVHKERYQVVCCAGSTYARLKSGVYYNDGVEDFPTVGDFVLMQYNPSGDSMITKTLARKTTFSRRNPTIGRGEQVVAANFDYVFIMQSLNHDFNTKRLERYVTLAWQSGAIPVVVMTKADLVTDYSAQLHQAEKTAAGVHVAAVSAHTGYGLDQLSKYVQPGKTVVFLGSSGVGKSSLVNALAGGDVMVTKEIRADDSRGRHTTTYRQLILLPCGGMLIDTPGMREIGMWDVDHGLEDAFSDIKEYLGQCKFFDCCHVSEPGCAIKGAIEAGALTPQRWQRYLALEKEIKYSNDRMTAMRDRKVLHKALTKSIKDAKANKARK